MSNMNKLSVAKRVQVLTALVDGNSIASTCRMAGVAKGTVLSLLEATGEACREYHNQTVRNLSCRRIQADEAWAFCHNKQKNVAPAHEGEFGYGDVWTWVALDADTKLAVNWLVSDRSGEAAYILMKDTADRLSTRVQLTTDGLKAYLEAVEGSFGSDVDYAQLIKIYGSDQDENHRYSPPACIGTETNVVQGNPDPKHVSTSYVERSNLTMRMGIRRFTRLTNAFSKKVENHAHSVSLHFLYYNFCRPHKSLKGQTPAMAAGIEFHQWEVMEIVALIEAHDIDLSSNVKSGGSN